MDIDTDDAEYLTHHLQEIRTLCVEELAATRRLRNAEKLERRERVKSVLARATGCPLNREAVQLVEDLAEPLIGDARNDLHSGIVFELIMNEASSAIPSESGGVS